MADKQDAKALAVTLAAGLEKDLGAVSAYAIAVEHGYEGTEEEWAAEMQKALNSVDESAASAKAAKESADAAAQSASSAESAAGEAAAEAAQKAAEDILPSIEGVISDTVEDNLDGVAIERTTTGEQFNLEDSSGATLRDLKIYGKATQGGTPSPEEPVDIMVAGSGGTVGVNFTGNQLFDASKLATKSQGGATVTNNNDGSFTVNGLGKLSTNFSINYNYTHEETLKLLKSGYIYVQNNDTIPRICAYLYYDNDTKYYTLIDHANSKFNITEEMLAKSDCKFRIYIFGTVGSTIKTGTIKPMLYQDGDGTWEPFREPQQLSLSTPNGLPGIPVESGGNYTDAEGRQWICDYVDCERGKYVHMTSTKTFNGSENWFMKSEPNGKNRIRLVGTLTDCDVDNVNIKVDALCNMYNIISAADTYNGNIGFSVDDAGTILIHDQSFIDIQSFKDFLQSNNLLVLYALKTPTETDLSAQEIAAYKALHTNRNITNIFSDTDPQVGMNLTYALDTQKYLDDKYYERVREGKADAIVSSVSGENLHVEDASDNGLDNLKIFGKATQDGTPSTENTVPITVSGSDGSIVITFTGENLLFPPKEESRTNAGTTFTKNDGYVSITGSATSTSANSYYIFGDEGVYENIPYPTGEYTFSSDLIPQGLVFYVVEEEKGRILIQLDSSDSPQSVQLDNSKKYRIFYRSYNPFSGTYDFKVMMNKGDSALPWVPYKEPQSFTISTPNGLSGIPVDSGGNYTDEKGQKYFSDVIDCSSGKWTHNAQALVLDSTNVNKFYIIDSPSATGRFSLVPSSLQPYKNAKPFTNLFCDKLTPQNLDPSQAGYCSINNQGYILFIISENVDTIEQLINHIQTNPITFLYQVNEPYETDLSAEEIAAYKALHTNKTTTNVFSDSDPQVGIQMDYEADTKTYIDKKFDALATAILKTGE